MSRAQPKPLPEYVRRDETNHDMRPCTECQMLIWQWHWNHNAGLCWFCASPKTGETPMRNAGMPTAPAAAPIHLMTAQQRLARGIPGTMALDAPRLIGEGEQRRRRAEWRLRAVYGLSAGALIVASGWMWAQVFGGAL